MSLIGVYWPFLGERCVWMISCLENCLRNMHGYSSSYSFTMKHLHFRSRFRTFRDGRMESLHGTLSYKHRDVTTQGGPFFSSMLPPGLETSTWNVPTHLQQKLQPFSPPASEGHEGQLFPHPFACATFFPPLSQTMLRVAENVGASPLLQAPKMASCYSQVVSFTSHDFGGQGIYEDLS